MVKIFDKIKEKKKRNARIVTAKVTISTPPGQASQAEKKLRTELINKRLDCQYYPNETDDAINWRVTGRLQDILKIQRKAFAFQKIGNIILTGKKGKAARKLAEKHFKEPITDELWQIVTGMIIKETKIEIIDTDA